MVVTNLPASKVYTYEQIQEDKAKFDEVFAYLKMYGAHSMAYSILQPKMNYFILEGYGIVAYSKLGKNGKMNYVLGDPLASREFTEYLLDEYLKMFPESQFVQVSERIAKLIYKIAGFYATPMGIETTVNSQRFDINGSVKKKFRNNIRNSKGEVQVYEENELDINEEAIEAVSQDWLNGIKKGKKEISFLARPLNLNYEKDVRTFYALTNENELMSFLIFNPVYKNNKIIGYCADMIRTSAKAIRGTGDFLLYMAIKKMRREGHVIIEMGLSPFADVDRGKLPITDNATKTIIKLIYSKLNFLYGFQGLAEHKKQFEGHETIAYFCHAKKLPLIDILKLFRICNVV